MILFFFFSSISCSWFGK